MSVIITLSDGTDTVDLHKDLYWSDQNNWHPVKQSVERSVTGTQIFDVGVCIGGRNITLEPEDDGSAWMSLSTVTALRNWAAVPGKQMTLTLHGTTYTVVFRHEDGGFEATPILHRDNQVGSDFYLCVIRLLEI